MKIAVYSRDVSMSDENFIDYMVRMLLQENHQVWVAHHVNVNFSKIQRFKDYLDLKEIPDFDFVFAVGGDGTFLEAASIVADLKIPIVGINTGRIGFLTGINKKDFLSAYYLLQEDKYTIEERSLLHLECDAAVDLPTSFALNDITLHSAGESFLSNYRVEIDGSLLNSYWADGLIIATPTGSTAYSLSCGGPILLPSTKGNIITPIASHSLSVRSVVIPSQHEISVTILGRGKQAILTMDSHRIEIPVPATVKITQEKFNIRFVRFGSVDFFKVIREKLYWGADKRNEVKG